jgi:hypothetical protein
MPRKKKVGSIGQLLPKEPRVGGTSLRKRCGLCVMAERKNLFSDLVPESAQEPKGSTAVYGGNNSGD